MLSKLTITKATLSDLETLVPLFDAYRVFYKQKTDEKAARNFLKARFELNESIIFLARNNNLGVGFTQLFHSFSSVSMLRLYILNDLYVDETHRGQGVAGALLKKAQDFCIEQGAKGISLETATDNPAQKLYEKLDWKKDNGFLHYFWLNN